MRETEGSVFPSGCRSDDRPRTQTTESYSSGTQSSHLIRFYVLMTCMDSTSDVNAGFWNRLQSSSSFNEVKQLVL